MSRILFLAADLCSGGAERQMVTVACLLKKEGYDVTIYCYDEADFYAPILQKAGIPIVWELELNNYYKRMLNVRRFIRKGKYDAVISFLPTCNFLNDVAAIGGHSWKVITGERSSRESTFTTRRGKFFGWLQRYTDYIVCNSQNACNMWRKYHPDYSGKMKVIYNCVHLGDIQSVYEPKNGDKLHVIVAATYQYLKNPLGLVESLTKMTEEEKSRLVIDWYGRKEIMRGDTKAYDDTAAAVSKNHLEDVLILHPDTNDIANKMNQADLVMLLSKFEGLPNVICEGMLIGKPIIMTRVSDYQTLVSEENGCLCDADNPQTIKEALLKMCDKSCEQLIEMGGKSKEKAVELFSDDHITKQWESLL